MLSGIEKQKAAQSMLATALRKAIAPTQSMNWAEAIIISAAALLAAVPVVAALYIIKSALGINLMEGPSPLHDLLYHFVA
ncbi:MAG TPA: hypothetical protein PLD46_02485 [Hyphomicrobium sp.]|nr:hypothetical protein [Hyphomicrobium sp.]